MRAGTICGGILAIILAGTAAAQEGPTPALRWADVAGRVDDLPRIREALSRSRAADAGVDEARQVPNPEAEARLGRGMPRDDGLSGLEWGVGLTVPLDWIGPRGAEVRAARSLADAGREDARAVRLEVLSRLAGLYWAVVHDQHLVEALVLTEAQVARLAALIRLRVEKGESRPTELPRFETELERVRLDLGRARAGLRADRRTLAVVLGLPDGAEPGVEPDLSPPPAPPSRDEAVARAVGRHPMLAAARARTRGAEAQVAVERARRIPGLSVGGYFERERDQDSAGGLVQVRLPVWNWNGGAIRRAEAWQAAEARAAEAAARDLEAQAGAAWERCVGGREAVARFDAEILPRAEAAARSVERGFELGEVSILDVLDARRVVLDARKERIAAGRDARTECTALAVLTGEVDDGN